MASWLFHWRLGWTALRRDWKSRELRLLAAALCIAVMAVSSVALLADRLGSALQGDTLQMLGGDLVIRSSTPFSDEVLRRAHDHGLETAQTVEFPSMVTFGTASRLAAIKAVSSGYPLYGSVRLSPLVGNGDAAQEPDQPVPQAGTVWIDDALADQLVLDGESTLEVGDSDLQASARIAHEPDRSLQFVNIAPRVLMRLDDLPDTGLLGPGARVSHRLLLAGSGQAISDFRQWIEQAHPVGLDFRTLGDSRPEVQRALDRAQQFLTLVALLTVALSALAIALAARRFTLRHQDAIATLRCMGVPKRTLATTLWVEFMTLAVLASLVGLAAGYLVHLGLVMLAGELLRVDFPASGAMPFIQALAVGVLLMPGFALPSLLALSQVPPLRVLRAEAGGATLRFSRSLATGLAIFLVMTLVLARDATMGIWLALGFCVVLAVFFLAGLGLAGITSLLRDHVVRWPLLRFTLAAMARRRVLTVVQVCAQSLGLAILLLLAITRTDLLDSWQQSVPPDAPDTFLVNIQPDQREPLQAALQAAGSGRTQFVPMARGRLIEINGQPVESIAFQTSRARAMVTREFNLSWRTDLPEGNIVTRGRWLDPGAHEASLERRFAASLGLQPGDRMTFELAGMQREVTVAGLRDVKWDTFNVNFFALLSQAALENVPVTYLVALRLPPEPVRLQQSIARDFPNVTVFDVRAMLGQVQRVLVHVITAIQLLFVFAVVAGLIVLNATLLVTREERVLEAALMRALGASRRQLLRSARLEWILLGALSGVLAAGAAQGLAWLLARHVFQFSLILTAWPWALGVGASIILALVSARMVLNDILDTPPLVTLRMRA